MLKIFQFHNMEGSTRGLDGQLVELVPDDARLAPGLETPLRGISQQAIPGWQCPSIDEYSGKNSLSLSLFPFELLNYTPKRVLAVYIVCECMRIADDAAAVVGPGERGRPADSG